MLWSEKLKHVKLWLGFNGWSVDSVDAFSLAISKALLSSPAKFKSLDLQIPLLSKMLGFYWKIATERADQSGLLLVNVCSLRYPNVNLKDHHDISLLLKICPNLKSFQSASTVPRGMQDYVVGYL